MKSLTSLTKAALITMIGVNKDTLDKQSITITALEDKLISRASEISNLKQQLAAQTSATRSAEEARKLAVEQKKHYAGLLERINKRVKTIEMCLFAGGCVLLTSVLINVYTYIS